MQPTLRIIQLIQCTTTATVAKRQPPLELFEWLETHSKPFSCPSAELVPLSICLLVHIPIWSSVQLSVSIRPSVHPFVHVFACLHEPHRPSDHLRTRPALHPFIIPSSCLSRRPSDCHVSLVHSPFRPSVHLSMCLALYQSIHPYYCPRGRTRGKLGRLHNPAQVAQRPITKCGEVARLHTVLRSAS